MSAVASADPDTLGVVSAHSVVLIGATLKDQRSQVDQ